MLYKTPPKSTDSRLFYTGVSCIFNTYNNTAVRNTHTRTHTGDDQSVQQLIKTNASAKLKQCCGTFQTVFNVFDLHGDKLAMSGQSYKSCQRRGEQERYFPPI